MTRYTLILLTVPYNRCGDVLNNCIKDFYTVSEQKSVLFPELQKCFRFVP